MQSAVIHPSTQATRTESSFLTRKGHNAIGPARFADKVTETPRQDSAPQERFELLGDESRKASRFFGAFAKRGPMLRYRLIRQPFLGLVALVKALATMGGALHAPTRSQVANQISVW